MWVVYIKHPYILINRIIIVSNVNTGKTSIIAWVHKE
jgi:hypothetical protein